MNPDLLDPHVILDALGYPNASAITPISGGRDAAIWRVEHAGASYALRVFRPEQAAITRYEVAAMRTAAAGGIPVPTVHAFDLWQGHPAMLLSWCEGRTVLAEAQARPWRAYGLGLMSGRTLARIHRLTAPAQSWSWWQSVTIDEPLREYLAAISRDDALLHLDYHPLNLLTDGYRVTAVLDWTNARCGDPRADLARSITILRLDTGELPPAARLLARIFERGLHRGYGPVDAFAPFLAWAGAYMLDDLSARLTPQQRTRIVAWIERWTRRSSTR